MVTTLAYPDRYFTRSYFQSWQSAYFVRTNTVKSRGDAAMFGCPKSYCLWLYLKFSLGIMLCSKCANSGSSHLGSMHLAILQLTILFRWSAGNVLEVPSFAKCKE